MKDLFRSGKFINQINSTFIALISKNGNVVSIKDFRPISLCNTLYKIFSKAIVNRIKPMLDKMISINQKCFVKGRDIMDVVIVAHELVHSMDNNKLLSMAFKLEISKAYDRVS